MVVFILGPSDIFPRVALPSIKTLGESGKSFLAIQAKHARIYHHVDSLRLNPITNPAFVSMP